MNPYLSRIASLRAVMHSGSVDAVIVPSADPHLSEYLPERWQGRVWLSGFTGSMATLIVTQDFAGLWTDSRYWVQAERELAGSDVELMRLVPGERGPFDWLASKLPEGAVVAVDGMVISVSAERELRKLFKGRCIRLLTEIDVLNEVWIDRPGLPMEKIFEHTLPYCAEAFGGKLNRVHAIMKEKCTDAYLIAGLDEIAWLLNLRGTDIPYNPVFLAYAIVEFNRVRLFVESKKLSPELFQVLVNHGVQLEPYDDVAQQLAKLPDDVTLMIDPAKVTAGILARVPAGVSVAEVVSPVTLLKSMKTSSEVENIRKAMIEDGVALCQFFSWFERAFDLGMVSELDVAWQLANLRGQRSGYVSESFSTIAGFNKNGALPHYTATIDAFSQIEGSGLLLIDSGAQYLGGTTDITRMVPVGEITKEQRTDCTRVLKGLIALSAAKFPDGIASPMLDAIARAPLWSELVNYGHGTGHGVGYFLNVHEGPQSIAYMAQVSPQSAMRAGMVTSIEPGTYRPGKWGVRIENLVLTTPAGSSGFGNFLEFETLTLCPIDTRCLDLSALNESEREWLDKYHRIVLDRLQRHLEGAPLAWLIERTQPIN